MSFPHATGNESLSYWIATSGTTAYPPLAEDARADVVIVGAGIVGITAAYLLAKAGRSVILLDRERIAMAETGHTTAHLQIGQDTPLPTLVERFGEEHARLAWDSQSEAVRVVEEIAREERIECELARVDAYLYAVEEKDREMLAKHRDWLRRFGYEAHDADAQEVPFAAVAALRLPNNAKFHPRKYLLALARKAVERGVRIHEATEVRKLHAKEGEPARVTTHDGHTVTADWLLNVTNSPIHVSLDLHKKIQPTRSYVIAARVPRGVFAEALYWDTADPYHYTRVERREDHDIVILGGEDHLIGSEDATDERYARLEEHLRTASPALEVRERWSGEVLETHDDLPYIGVAPGAAAHHLIATGFSGTGMTNGTIAAVMLAERVLGRGTPWDDIFDPARIHREVPDAREGGGKPPHGRDPKFEGLAQHGALLPGEGVILKSGGKPVAVARTLDGAHHAVDAACTHVGCTVAWNRAEQSWDCPCHGSRFAPNGDVLHGPAHKPLARVDVSKVAGKLRGVDAGARDAAR